MSVERRNYLLGVLAILAAGGLLGFLYGRIELGMLIAAMGIVFFQLRQLFLFDTALRKGDFSGRRPGGRLWSRAYLKLEKLANRGLKHKRRYRRLVKEVRKSTRAMPDGAIILDQNCRIVLCNPAAQDLVGFDSRMDRGQRVDNILRSPDFVAYLEAENPEEGIEIPSPLREGDWLYCRIVPYGEKERLLLIRDVTERVRLNKMRRDFVANASHELRSPLTVISGYLDALAVDPEVPEDWRRPLGQMRLQTARMNSIVAELIELSRLETAGAAPTDTEVDVPSIVNAVINRLSGDAGVPEITVSIETNATLIGRDSDLETILNNLLTNAIRHTPEDGRIVVSWALDNEHGVLGVADTGEGIAENHLPRLTERFFRVDRGRSRADGGVGLGLAIVKYALNRHEAELDVISTVGEGSTFSCRFPPERVRVPRQLSAAGTV